MLVLPKELSGHVISPNQFSGLMSFLVSFLASVSGEDLSRESDLAVAVSGGGDSLALAVLLPLAGMIDEAQGGTLTGLRVLVVTPLRAVTRDAEKALAIELTPKARTRVSSQRWSSASASASAACASRPSAPARSA